MKTIGLHLGRLDHGVEARRDVDLPPNLPHNGRLALEQHIEILRQRVEIDPHRLEDLAPDALDADEDLDLLLAGYGGYATYLTILYRNDGGSFNNDGTVLTGVIAGDVAWGDYDDDGDPDIALTGTSLTGPPYEWPPVSKIYRNDAGSFTDIAAELADLWGSSVAWGDYDVDGDLDLLLAGISWAEHTDSLYVSRLYRNDGQSFQREHSWLLPVANGAAAWGDYDADGDPDLVLAGDAGLANLGPSNAAVAVYRNTKLAYPAATAAGTVPAQNALDVPVSTDISVTFDVDMYAGSIDENTFLVHGRCSGPHDGAVVYDPPSRTATLDPALDFTEGELVTVVATDMTSAQGAPFTDYAWSFTSAAAGGSGAFPDEVAYSVGDGPGSVVLAELDGDGDLDLAAANRLSNTVAVRLNQGDGTFGVESTHAVGTTPSSVHAADLDGDGDLDLAVTNQGDDTISVLWNAGGAWFAADSTYATGSAPRSVFASDFDADGDLDLATANWGGDVSILPNQGDGTFPFWTSCDAGEHPRSVFGADLDNDGDVDLAVANESSDDISVFLNQGDGTFGTQMVYSAGDAPLWMFGADLDGDGDVDLATANYWTDDVSVFVNFGDGTFAAAQSVPAGDGPQSVFASDVDGDGDLDLVVANVLGDDVSILRNHGDGSFAPQAVYDTGDNPNCVFSADLDGDGDLDLVTANYESDDVSVLMNNEAVGVQPADTGSLPVRYALHRLAPNPFRAGTKIAFDLPAAGRVRLDIYDVSGRCVCTLVNGEMDPGRYSMIWDGLNSSGKAVADGVYFVRVSAGSFTAARKLVVLR